MSERRVGFVGLGTMGEPMVRSLCRAGYAVTASAHRRRDAIERLIAECGISEAANPADVAAACEVVAVCVPDAPDVEEVIFGTNGIARGAQSGAFVIDMSTISPVASRDFAQRLRVRSVRFADAPLSGGPARAGTGTLTIMVGADDADFARAEPLLSALGTPYHLGPVGMGETVKLVNQIIIAGIMIANAEGLVFARRAGADLNRVREVLATATASNYLLEQWLPKTWLAGTFDGGFALDLLRKDLAAALDAARVTDYPMPATGLAYQIYTSRSAMGDGALDYSAVVKSYERIVGDQARPHGVR
ncbi:MAG: NAD(P)-dependent oxidoreductase [Candidatus Eremiobacteraeota bacterium]|nr:NAD(P)-dependent oxidoreductase [Candidatus Eremiobacteraeota bacterium]MBV8372433.1 NAD(P)-dependent oxidoreductase [Candidatus Eremiobacteraeota bacterium]